MFHIQPHLHTYTTMPRMMLAFCQKYLLSSPDSRRKAPAALWLVDNLVHCLSCGYVVNVSCSQLILQNQFLNLFYMFRFVFKKKKRIAQQLSIARLPKRDKQLSVFPSHRLTFNQLCQFSVNILTIVCDDLCVFNIFNILSLIFFFWKSIFVFQFLLLLLLIHLTCQTVFILKAVEHLHNPCVIPLCFTCLISAPVFLCVISLYALFGSLDLWMVHGLCRFSCSLSTFLCLTYLCFV